MACGSETDCVDFVEMAKLDAEFDEDARKPAAIAESGLAGPANSDFTGTTSPAIPSSAIPRATNQMENVDALLSELSVHSFSPRRPTMPKTNRPGPPGRRADT